MQGGKIGPAAVSFLSGCLQAFFQLYQPFLNFFIRPCPAPAPGQTLDVPSGLQAINRHYVGQ
jgi:hypothetical protein